MEFESQPREEVSVAVQEAADKAKDVLISRFKELGDQCPELEFPFYRRRGLLVRLQSFVLDQYEALVLEADGLNLYNAEVRADGTLYLSDFGRKKASPLTYINMADSALFTIDKLERSTRIDRIRAENRPA